MRKFTNLHARVVRLGFSPEGTELTAATRGTMRVGVWQFPSGKFRRWHPYIDDAVSSFAYSPDGKWLVMGGVIGLVLPYFRSRIGKNDGGYDSEMHARRPIEGLAFSSRVVKGHTVVAVGADRVRLYDLDGPYGPGKGLWDEELPSSEGWFRSVAFHPTADILVGCDTINRHMRVWNPLKRDQSTLVVRKVGPTAATFSASGDRLLVAYGGHSQVLDSKNWETVAECKHARGRVTDVAASPCGRWFASAGSDDTVRFWNSTTGKAGPVFDWRIGSVTALAFSPDGLTCAAGGEKGQVVVWDVDT